MRRREIRTSIFNNARVKNSKSDLHSLAKILVNQHTASLPNFENQIKGCHLPSQVLSNIKTMTEYKYKVGACDLSEC